MEKREVQQSGLVRVNFPVEGVSLEKKGVAWCWQVQDVAFEYGKRVGLAFQLMDDILDFEGKELTLGKPTLNDLR